MTRKLLFAFTLLITFSASAQINLYVDSTMTTSGAGMSWITAKKTLSEALTIANAGSSATKYIINIAKGTYYPTGIQSAGNRDSAFTFNRGGIWLVAGYPSGGGTLNTTVNKVVLSGNINNTIDYSDNSYHIIVIAGIPNGADSISISGLTISEGYASGSSTKNYHGISVQRYSGAGLVVTTDSNIVSLSNCIFSGNWAYGNPSNGGAIYNFGSNVYLNSCAFTDNICNGPNASHSGGAIYNEQTMLTMSTCTFTGNTGSAGGAMYSLSTQASISGCTFDK